MRNRWNDFRCLYLAKLEEDLTHEVEYSSRYYPKETASPNFSVMVSIEGLECRIPSNMLEANPRAVKLFDGSTITLCLATNGAEFAPGDGDERIFQFNPITKTGFIVIQVPSVEVASSIATQLRTHKQIGLYLETAANEEDFSKFDQTHLIEIPIWSTSITLYASGKPFK